MTLSFVLLLGISRIIKRIRFFPHGISLLVVTSMLASINLPCTKKPNPGWEGTCLLGSALHSPQIVGSKQINWNYQNLQVVEFEQGQSSQSQLRGGKWWNSSSPQGISSFNHWKNCSKGKNLNIGLLLVSHFINFICCTFCASPLPSAKYFPTKL